MRKIKIKTIWQGKVAIRDKQLDEAWGQRLLFVHGNEKMIINPGEIKKKIVGKSKIPFRDRYSREQHYLVYFKWQPMPDNQQKLI